MKQQPTQSITSLPASPDDERRARMIKYSVMMGIRVACIFALLFAQGWWILVFAAGAIFLPYFAVIVANVGTSRRDQEVLRPGGLVPLEPGTDAAGADPAPDADPRFRAASDVDPRDARPEGDAA
ncbi:MULTISPECIES: DUF3099 domain-containing protein [unclassified Agromyces]|uniref:DUF3099 domain-containing protein n=1 Tax=unclassified Agromyces TaxID=2639701 RepID=UPI003014E526